MAEEALSPSKALADRLLALRNAHGWTQTELAERMRSFGWSWDRTTVAKLESGSRQLSLDEFIALAWVLGVPPGALVTPLRTSERLAVTPATSQTSVEVWLWFGGRPLALGRYKDEVVTLDDAQRAFRFSEESAPDFVVNAEQELPGLRRLVELLRGVQSLVGQDAGDGVLRRTEADLLGEAADLLASIRRRSKRQLRRLNGET